MPLFIAAQENLAIQFEQGHNWEQIKEKAAADKKYIFVDCYATWCGPCKLMDAKVYTNDTVGEFFNNKFISVKLQFDTGKNDNQNIRLLYSTAREFEKKYHITAFPTYLIFFR